MSSQASGGCDSSLKATPGKGDNHISKNANFICCYCDTEKGPNEQFQDSLVCRWCAERTLNSESVSTSEMKDSKTINKKWNGRCPECRRADVKHYAKGLCAFCYRRIKKKNEAALSCEVQTPKRIKNSVHTASSTSGHINHPTHSFSPPTYSHQFYGGFGAPYMMLGQARYYAAPPGWGGSMMPHANRGLASVVETPYNQNRGCNGHMPQASDFKSTRNPEAEEKCSRSEIIQPNCHQLMSTTTTTGAPHNAQGSGGIARSSSM